MDLLRGPSQCMQTSHPTRLVSVHAIVIDIMIDMWNPAGLVQYIILI